MQIFQMLVHLIMQYQEITFINVFLIRKVLSAGDGFMFSKILLFTQKHKFFFFLATSVSCFLEITNLFILKTNISANYIINLKNHSLFFFQIKAYSAAYYIKTFSGKSLYKCMYV